jgi:hypothetical protein
VDGLVSIFVTIRFPLVVPVGALAPAAGPPAADPLAGAGTLAAGMTVDPLLDRIDAYCDAVPRTAARAEAHGPLTLFVNDGPGWSFYARPTRGTATVTPSSRQPCHQSLDCLMMLTRSRVPLDDRGVSA